MRIAFFDEGPLLPPRDGGTTRIYQLVRNLALEGCEVFLFKCYRSNFGGDSPELYINQPFKTLLIPPDIFYNKQDILKGLFEKYKINVFQMSDTESAMLSGSKLKSSKNFFVFDPHFLSSKISQNFEAKSNVDVALFKEICSVYYSDLIATTCKSDENKLRLYFPDKKYTQVPNGVDTKEITYTQPDIENQRLLIVGNMYFEPNSSMLKDFITNIFPLVKKEYPQAKVTVIGYYPKRLKSMFKEVEFVGFVNDLNIWFKKSTICLLPAFKNHGSRIKVYYYLASGIPTVLTPNVESVSIENWKHAIFAGTYKEFADSICKLLGNKKLLFKISRNGRRLAVNLYDWKKIVKDYIRVLESSYKKI